MDVLMNSVRTQHGQAMVEYGLILGLVTVVGFLGVMVLQGGVQSLYHVLKALAV